jgi:hypothetical protein
MTQAPKHFAEILASIRIFLAHQLLLLKLNDVFTVRYRLRDCPFQPGTHFACMFEKT